MVESICILSHKGLILSKKDINSRIKIHHLFLRPMISNLEWDMFHKGNYLPSKIKKKIVDHYNLFGFKDVLRKTGVSIERITRSRIRSAKF